MNLRLLLMPMAMLTIGAAGCSPPTGDVSGTVRYKGQTVDGGQVEIIPPNGQPYLSVIKTDGSYLITKVPVGESRVIVMKVPPGGSGRAERPAEREDSKTPPRASVLPEKYATVGTTPLVYTVQPGVNKYDIDLVD
jgi:hypothetical protein